MLTHTLSLSSLDGLRWAVELILYGLTPFLTIYFMNLPFLLTLELVFWCVTVLLIIVPLCAPRNDPLTGADLGHAYTEFTDKNFDNVKALNTMLNTLCIMEKEFCDIMFNSIEILPLMDIFTVGLGMVLVSSRAPRSHHHPLPLR